MQAIFMDRRKSARLLLFVLCLVSSCTGQGQEEDSTDTTTWHDEELSPTVTIVLLASNKAHILPYSLRYLDDLDYPKDRIALYIRSDHNLDDTEAVLRNWLSRVDKLYHLVHVEYGPPEEVWLSTDWTDERFSHLMHLKEGGLRYARSIWADFVWFLDADALITNPNTLQDLTSSGYSVVAPLLTSVGLYANFWAGMTDNYYYTRTDNYLPIRDRKSLGCHPVPMVHSSFLVNLHKADSTKLTFLPEKIEAYDGPNDDIIAFALSAKLNGVPLIVCNRRIYGYITIPLEADESFDDEMQHLSDLKLQMIADDSAVKWNRELFINGESAPRPKDRLGADNVYMINLERRVERKKKMDACFDELGVDYEWLRAVDGRTLQSEQSLVNLGVKMLPDFSEPYHKRALTFGEIGCFLSHYNVWQDVLKRGYDHVIVFEDDLRFEPYFRAQLDRLRLDVERLQLDWDLIFLGRKILYNVDEPFVTGSERLVHVGYTYWTLAYMLSQRGASKLVAGQPLSKMLPVDEYLPIMFDRHPNATWKAHFKPRNLKAFSAHPLLVHPTHYTGEPGYFSDTEATRVIATEHDEL